MATEDRERVVNTEEPPRRQRPEKPVREKPEKSLRLKRREERREFVRLGREPRKVRVTPTSDVLRKALRHPRKGGFRATGSMEWPLDSFTKRRLRDGDITVEHRDQNPKTSSNAGEGNKPTSGQTAA